MNNIFRCFFAFLFIVGLICITKLLVETTDESVGTIYFKSINNYLVGLSSNVEDNSETKKLSVQIARKLRCLETDWMPRKTTHKDAPIRKLPEPGNIILPFSSDFQFCPEHLQNLRVVFVHSRFNSPDKREMVRKTYANFSNYQKVSLKGNWTLFFLLGKPNTYSELRLVETESRTYGDIVVANSVEEYYSATYKILIGLKVVSCFCSHANYLIKTDDDIYLLPGKLEELLLYDQNLANKNSAKFDKNITVAARQLNAASFYTGAHCGSEIIPISTREGRHGTTKEEYPIDEFEFFCWGGLNIFSVQLVHALARECPHHCMGKHMQNEEESAKYFCYHKIEDQFIGSCVSLTQREQTVQLVMDESLFKYIHNIAEVNQSDPSGHVAVHSHQTRQDWENSHTFYLQRNLVH